MTEKDLLEKIKSSAEEIEIQESLSPDAIKKKLDAAVAANSAQESTDRKEEKKLVSISGKKRWYTNRKGIAAAVMLLVCGTGALAVTQWYGTGADGSSAGSADMASAESAVESAENGQGEAGAVTDSIEPEKKVDAGEMYVVAKNYGEVYDVLKGPGESVWDTWFNGSTDGTAKETAGGMEESAIAESAAESTGAMAEDSASSQTTRGDEAYSKTNLQTAGVDESDIIKTDGDYIYIVDDNAVKIIDIRSTEMQECGEIDISLRSAADGVVEMYIDGDRLNLIVHRETADLQEEDETTYVTDAMTVCDVYHVSTNVETELLTYDISDHSQPELIGSITQDGSYKTSRKVDDIVYLFTEKYIELPDMTRTQATRDEAIEGWIPAVNDEAVAADCIYLPERGEYGLLISSVDVEKPDEIVDNALIVNDYVNIYVSTNAIYLYETDYFSVNGVSDTSKVTTQIAKFRFDKGRINAVAAASAAGEVYDTFAINECQGKLRVLTTDWSSSGVENQLYLFDEELNLTGSLKGIAKGEQVYAARYLGDMVYFVTYRNTDPLFAVDLSDEKNPKILSELKITGFSEYLHFWGKDKLVGIGYETDPDTDERKGLKLSMFDISDPANLTTLESCVIADVDYSPALYDYKCVLADADENLIGFTAQSYGGNRSDEECTYQLFSWQDGSFKSLMIEKLGIEDTLDEYRGIYVGDMFYLVNTEQITAYDRNADYERMQTLKWR